VGIAVVVVVVVVVAVVIAADVVDQTQNEVVDSSSAVAADAPDDSDWKWSRKMEGLGLPPMTRTNVLMTRMAQGPVGRSDAVMPSILTALVEMRHGKRRVSALVGTCPGWLSS